MLAFVLYCIVLYCTSCLSAVHQVCLTSVVICTILVLANFVLLLCACMRVSVNLKDEVAFVVGYKSKLPLSDYYHVMKIFMNCPVTFTKVNSKRKHYRMGDKRT